MKVISNGGNISYIGYSPCASTSKILTNISGGTAMHVWLAGSDPTMSQDLVSDQNVKSNEMTPCYCCHRILWKKLVDNYYIIFEPKNINIDDDRWINKTH